MFATNMLNSLISDDESSGGFQVESIFIITPFSPPKFKHQEIFSKVLNSSDKVNKCSTDKIGGFSNTSTYGDRSALSVQSLNTAITPVPSAVKLKMSCSP